MLPSSISADTNGGPAITKSIFVLKFEALMFKMIIMERILTTFDKKKRTLTVLLMYSVEEMMIDAEDLVCEMLKSLFFSIVCVH